MPKTKAYLTISEFADALGKSRATVHRWCVDEVIESVPVGGEKLTRLRIPAKELDRIQRLIAQGLPPTCRMPAPLST